MRIGVLLFFSGLALTLSLIIACGSEDSQPSAGLIPKEELVVEDPVSKPEVEVVIENDKAKDGFKPIDKAAFMKLFEGRAKVASKPHEERMEAALQWLADHQNPLGCWNPEDYLSDSIRVEREAAVTHNIDFNDQIPKDTDKGWDSAKVGATGLALLAFAGAGHTHLDGKYRLSVKAGLKWVLKQQSADGFFG